MQREQHWLCFGLGTVCFVPGLLLYSAGISTWAVALCLLLACLLGLRLWLGLMGVAVWPLRLLATATAALALAAFGGAMLPLAGALCADLLAPLRRLGAFWTACVVALLGVATGAGLWAWVCTLLVLLPWLCTQALLQRLDAVRQAEAAVLAENQRLRTQLMREERGAQALEQAARLEERSRLAARIHDKIGHGVSGSILLLEGAMLALDNDPDAARQTVATATDNLRASVDEIRASLREERAPRAVAGLASIRAALAAFGVQHPGVHTRLEAEGHLDEVPADVWFCIEENLREALTNLLKHSDASEVAVCITRQAKLLRAEIQDNGGPGGPVVPGIGLDAMAERCARCGGRMFAGTNASGFCITMTFTEARRELP